MWPVDDRWKLEAIAALHSLPRKPNPASASREPQAQMVPDNRSDGSRLEQPEASYARGGPRELQITSRILEKYGCTNGCPRCIHKQLGLENHRQYSAVCRQRIYNMMKDDAEELDRLERAERRMGRIPRHEEQLQRHSSAFSNE